MNAVIANQSTINLETIQLHQSLIAQHQALSDRLTKINSVDAADAILREMQEINFRVMISGSLLFKQTTAQIDDSLRNVVAASDHLKTSITQANKINDIIKATSKFLGLVDKVLDRIKLL